MAWVPKASRVRWEALVVVAFAWIASLWFVALLQFVDVFGEDDQPWQAVLFGNVVYAVVVTGVPISIGWAIYAGALPAVWRRTAAAPALLAPVLCVSALVFPWRGRLLWALPVGYAVLAVALVHAIGRRRQWNSTSPVLPGR